MHRQYSSSSKRDPSGYGQGLSRTSMASSSSSSNNILAELYDIEQALSNVTGSAGSCSTSTGQGSGQDRIRYSSQNNPSSTPRSNASSRDWYSTTGAITPRSAASVPSNNNNQQQHVGPPLLSEKFDDYYNKRFSNNNENRNNNTGNSNTSGNTNVNTTATTGNGSSRQMVPQPPRSPLVRFSDQLEVYSKHISQGCNTPTIPILRSKSSGSSSNHNNNNNNERKQQQQHLPLQQRPQRQQQQQQQRDPTPRAIEYNEGQHGRREPPANRASSSSATDFITRGTLPVAPSSDPPIDRSGRLMVSPAASRTRPASAQQLSRQSQQQQHQQHLSRGTLSLHGNSNRRGGGTTMSDVELNPRRLASEFNKQQASALRKGLAPTPTNREHRQQAPTPNHNRIASSDWPSLPLRQPTQPDAPKAPSPKVWNVASLFANPCTSPFTEPAKITVAPTTANHNNFPVVLPPAPTNKTKSIQEQETRRLSSSNIGLNRAQGGIGPITAHPASFVLDTTSDRGKISDASESLTTSTSLLTERWRDQDNDETSTGGSSAESASAFLIGRKNSQGDDEGETDDDTKDQQWERGPTLQSGPQTPTSGSSGSLFSEDTTQSPDVCSSSVPSYAPHSDSKIYEAKKLNAHRRAVAAVLSEKKKPASYLQLGDEGSLRRTSVDTEIMTLPTSIEVRIGEDSTVDTRPQDDQTDNSRGYMGVLQRFRSTKKVPFQELNGDMFSYSDSFENCTEPTKNIIKQRASETDDSTDSGMNFRIRASNWDQFHKDNESDCEDDEILIASSAKPSFQGDRTRRRTCILWLFTCSLIIFVAAGISAYFLLTRDKSSVSQADSSTNSPKSSNATNQDHSVPGQELNMEDCVMLHGDQASDYSKRYGIFKKYLKMASAGSTSLVDQPNSAQRKALCWLAEGDDYKIDVDEGNKEAIVQRYSLAVLYYSLAESGEDNSESLKNSDFLSPEHECSWDVTMCSEPGVVSALLLADKQLSGSLPAEIGNLVHLSFLELSLNQLTGDIPSSVQRLTLLEYFSMSFNQLSGSIPSEVGRMTNLQYFNMRSSLIQGTVPSELGFLTKLESLLLEGNKLTGTIPSSLGNLIKSEQMTFRRNYLSGRVAVELCELRDEGTLTELTVDYWISCDCCTS